MRHIFQADRLRCFVRKTFCQDRLRVRGCRWLHVVMGGCGVVMDGCMALRVFECFLVVTGGNWEATGGKGW